MELAYRLWPSEKAFSSPQNRILLLHGLGGTGSLWRPVAASLESDFSILAPDQRGHGESQLSSIPGGRASAQYTPLNYGEDLTELIETLQFHPTWVVGHSMGVRSACALAHLKPEWVRGLVSIDLGFSGPAGGGMGETLASFLKILPMHFESRAEARAYLEASSPDLSIGRYLLAVSQATPEGGLTFPFDKGALMQTIEAARTASVRAWVREFAQTGKPVLVLRGAQSLVFSAENFELEKQAFKDLPQVKFVEIEGTGHGLPFEKRALFVEVLRELTNRYA